MQHMNGTGLSSHLIQMCKNACSKFGDFVENSLSHQATLQEEVVGAYRCAAAHQIESMASKRTLIVCKR